VRRGELQVKGHQLTLFAAAPVHEGSWWPAWQAWLQQHSSAPMLIEQMPPSTHVCDALGAAPGRYVLMP
jgi:polyhydroxyalkanoate synthase